MSMLKEALALSTIGEFHQTLRGALNNPNLRASPDLWIPTRNDPGNPELVLAKALAGRKLGVSVTEPCGEIVFIRVSPRGRESLEKVFHILAPNIKEAVDTVFPR